MTRVMTYRRNAGRGSSAPRRGLLVLMMLVLPALAACEFDGMIGIGGEGREAEPVAKTPPAMPREDVKAVQKTLSELGYEPGPVDGIAGANTRAAIRRYQERAGVPVDGEVTKALLKQLQSKPVAAPDALPAPDTGGEIAADDVVINGKDVDLPPHYETGDVFVWSDGLVETVVRAGSDRVFWRDNNGTSFNAYPNFVIPPSSWDRASGPGSASISADAAKLWPFRETRSVKFRVTTTGPAGIEPEREWQCKSQGKRKVTVPAGTFDTLVITCKRDPVVADEWRYRTWFYAPAARHYVRRVDRFEDDSVRAVGLVAIKPGGNVWPPAVRAGLDWAVQDALDDQPVGASIEWSSTSVPATFSIMPTGSREAEYGKICRTYILVRQSGGERRSYPAVACQEGKAGNWRIPILDDDSPPAAAVMRPHCCGDSDG